MNRRDFLKLSPFVPLALAPLGCAQETRIQTQGFLLYGMLLQLSLPENPPVAIETALSEVERIVKREYAIIHPWQDSPLTRLNAALPSCAWVALEPELRPFIERACALETASGATFSPAIGALVGLWGFHSSSPNTERPLPPQADIDRLMSPPPRMSDLEIDGERIRSRNPHLQLDFNAMAEGWVAEMAMTQLKSMGLHDALLDTGGDLRLAGRAGKRAWRIAIQDPFTDGALASLDAEEDRAIFSSGSYHKRFVHDGISYAHVIDPRSGWPSRGLVGTTVVNADAVLADAAATALLAAGLDDAPGVAQAMGIKQFLLVDEQGGLHIITALAPRLTLLREARHTIIIPT